MTSPVLTPGTVRRIVSTGSSLITRFGEAVDVRNRGTLRAAKSAVAPAVVRLWHDEQCREMSSHDARALAAQLVAAANLADVQNGH